MDKQSKIAKKIIILYVLNILRQATPDRPITQSAIADFLNERGIPCDRKTVGRNVGYLIEFGYPIVRVERKGYYIDSEKLKECKNPFVI